MMHKYAYYSHRVRDIISRLTRERYIGPDEIVAATKLAIATEGKAHTFGSVVRMGQRQIASQLPAPTE